MSMDEDLVGEVEPTRLKTWPVWKYLVVSVVVSFTGNLTALIVWQVAK